MTNNKLIKFLQSKDYENDCWSGMLFLNNGKEAADKLLETGAAKNVYFVAAYDWEPFAIETADGKEVSDLIDELDEEEVDSALFNYQYNLEWPEEEICQSLANYIFDDEEADAELVEISDVTVVHPQIVKIGSIKVHNEEE